MENGSKAEAEGELWGTKAVDWADLQEPAWHGVFEAALSNAGVKQGTRLLDVGSGAGGALLLARGRGAKVTGLDAAEPLVRIARARLPGARIEVGDMEALPFADQSFDVVTGINAFQFAADVPAALAEARRVCRIDGTVLMLVWGPREDCDLMRITMTAVLALLPTAPGARRGPQLARAEIERAMLTAGLTPVVSGSFGAELAFADQDTALRAILSAGATVRATQLVGETAVRNAVADTLAAVTRSDGRVVWQNRFLWVRARRLIGQLIRSS